MKEPGIDFYLTGDVTISRCHACQPPSVLTFKQPLDSFNLLKQKIPKTYRDYMIVQSKQSFSEHISLMVHGSILTLNSQ